MSDFSVVARCKKHGKFCPDDSGGSCPGCEDELKTYIITISVKARDEKEAVLIAQQCDDTEWKNCEIDIVDE